jgi:hypothetical protein
MGGKKTKIDLEQLRVEIEAMTYKSTLYLTLKEALSKRGYWKALKRGKPNPRFTKGGRI